MNDEEQGILRGKNFAAVATLMPDGSPHVTLTWVDVDGDVILINTAEGRVKVKNVRRDPRVAILVADRENDEAVVSVRGRVVDVTTHGADEHIDRLAKKYLGKETYPFRQPGEIRLVLKVQPERVLRTG